MIHAALAADSNGYDSLNAFMNSAATKELVRLANADPDDYNYQQIALMIHMGEMAEFQRITEFRESHLTKFETLVETCVKSSDWDTLASHVDTMTEFAAMEDLPAGYKQQLDDVIQYALTAEVSGRRRRNDR